MRSPPPCPENANSSGYSRGCDTRRIASLCLSRDRPSARPSPPAQQRRPREQTLIAQYRFASIRSSNDFQIQPLDHVVVIAGGIVDQLLDLGFARAAGGARHDDHRAALAGRYRKRELAERKTSQILAKPGYAPGSSGIGGDLDTRDAGAAVPCEAFHFDRLAPS